MYVNLLPAPFILRLALRRQAVNWGLATGMVVVLCGGWMATQYRGIVAARQSQSASAFRSKDLRAVTADTTRLLAEAKTIESKISVLEKARPQDRTLTLLGIASTSAGKLEGKVHLKNVAMQMASMVAVAQQAPPAAGQPGSKPAPPVAGNQTPNDLILEGNAEDAAAIARFVEALRETGIFARVELTATNESSGASGAARQFRVDCKF